MTYALSFSVLAGQFIIGDVLGVTIVNQDGVEVKSALLEILDMDHLNAVTREIANSQSQTNSTLSNIENAFGIGLYVGWDILNLLLGTYIFNFLLLMGVPFPIIVGMLVMYFLLVARTIIAYIRGV